VLTGSARLAQEAQERSALLSREQEIGRKQKELGSKRAAMEARVIAIRAEFASLEAAALAVIDQAEVSEDLLTRDRQDMAQSRRVDAL
jgi:circadian clock protein KaiC